MNYEQEYSTNYFIFLLTIFFFFFQLQFQHCYWNWQVRYKCPWYKTRECYYYFCVHVCMWLCMFCVIVWGWLGWRNKGCEVVGEREWVGIVWLIYNVLCACQGVWGGNFSSSILFLIPFVYRILPSVLRRSELTAGNGTENYDRGAG